MSVAVKLEIFEGPLDLLLHLIRKNEVDVYDIPIALITKQYLAYLELMRELNIGLAGEFLVMASTLTHIKSRMLLPSRGTADEDEESDDPRQDLVAQLKEHMRIKTAAGNLDERPRLGRDVFGRETGRDELEEIQSRADDGEEQLAVGLFELVNAFHQLMNRRGTDVELNLPTEGISIEARMTQLLDMFKHRPACAFEDCFPNELTRPMLVVSFMALLELTRLGLIRLYQVRMENAGPGAASWGPLRISYRPPEETETGEG